VTNRQRQLRPPGSSPDIPKTADIEFIERHSTRKPGTKERVGFLRIEATDSSLVILPYRNWIPELGVEIECVLFPLQNAAIAVPVGGLDDSGKSVSEALDEIVACMNELYGRIEEFIGAEKSDA